MKFLPSACNMPDLLSGFPPLSPAEMLMSSTHLSENAFLMRRNIVRLVDKAIHEYSFARQAILNQIAERNRPVEEMMGGRVIYMFGFINHMENCLNAVRRVLELMKGLKSDRSIPVQNRDRRKTIERETVSLIKIRDTLEHMGEHINKGVYSNGQPAILCLSGDEESICIGSHALSFASLVSVLTDLHAEAMCMLGFNLTT